MNVRNLQPGEDWPEGCEMGYRPEMMYYDWVWVAEDEGKTVAALITSPAHGVLLMLRLAASPGSCPSAIYGLVRAAIDAAEERGLIGYIVWADPTTRPGQWMLGMTERVGGRHIDSPAVLCCGTIKDLRQRQGFQGGVV